MVQDFFSAKRLLKQFKFGILAPHYDKYSETFVAHGYSRSVAQNHLRLAKDFANFAVFCGVTSTIELTREVANKFLDNVVSQTAKNRSYEIAKLFAFLEAENIVCRVATVQEKPTRINELLSSLDEHLDKLRGLCEKTRAIHRLRASAFFLWFDERYGIKNLHNLTAKDVLDFQSFIIRKEYSSDFKRTLTSCLRVLLRFLKWENITTSNFTDVVVLVNQWQLDTIPQYIPFEDVKLLLQAPDNSTAVGKRDLAMLVLMAHLGLRAHEVIGIKISDIDFASGSISIRHTKSMQQQLVPLTNEVAHILLDYIQNGRNNAPYDELFIQTFAPHKPIIAPSTLGTMVRKYIKKVGIATPTLGTHQLRHSLATHLINNGVAIKEIADLLRHKNISTTMIYAKVQIDQLKTVALPFPSARGVL